MTDTPNPFFLALSAQYQSSTGKLGANPYTLALEAVAGFKTFIHRLRLTHEALAMGQHDPSLARIETGLQAEQLADFEEHLESIAEDLPGQGFVETLALARLQQDEPAYYQQLTQP